MFLLIASHVDFCLKKMSSCEVSTCRLFPGWTISDRVRNCYSTPIHSIYEFIKWVPSMPGKENELVSARCKVVGSSSQRHHAHEVRSIHFRARNNSHRIVCDAGRINPTYIMCSMCSNSSCPQRSDSWLSIVRYNVTWTTRCQRDKWLFKKSDS